MYGQFCVEVCFTVFSTALSSMVGFRGLGLGIEEMLGVRAKVGLRLENNLTACFNLIMSKT